MQQMLFWVAMVSSVSPSCVNATPSKLISSTVRPHAMALAIAVIDAVSSHAFIVSPSTLYYARVRPVANAARDVCSYNSARPGRHKMQATIPTIMPTFVFLRKWAHYINHQNRHPSNSRSIHQSQETLPMSY